jgi:hypothetical protein
MVNRIRKTAGDSGKGIPMNEQNPGTGESAKEPVANFQAYGNSGVMYKDGSSSLGSELKPTQAFMSALQAMEQDRDVSQLAARFHPSCKLWRQSYGHAYDGVAGAQKFWTEYLNQFASIATDFTHVQEREGLAILEWESRGALLGGRPIHYRGVSILELGAEGKVTSFKTYFDSAHFIAVHAVMGNA